MKAMESIAVTGNAAFVSQFVTKCPSWVGRTGLQRCQKPAYHRQREQGFCVWSSVLLPNAHNRRVFLKTLAAIVPMSLISPVFSDVLPERDGASLEAAAGISSKPVLDIDPSKSEPEITDRVYLDFSLNGGPVSRVTIGLYGGIAPITVANFKELVKNGYAGTSVYRVVPGLTVQMGDVLKNGGKSGRAANGSSMAQENFRVMHSIPGIVSMAHDQNGMVDSRFFVNTRPGDSGYLDGKYCAFGRVLENMNFLYEVENAAERHGGFVSRLPKVIIEACGVLS